MNDNVEDPETKREYFQDHMGHNVCYGCGKHNVKGLQIQSYWDGDEAICEWQSKEHHHGWPTIMNGGIMATLIDCHSMCTAMAYAYKEEGRSLDSDPIYRYATGSMNIKYLKPTSNEKPVRLVATVESSKGRKINVRCAFYSDGVKTAEADVVAIRVFDSSQQVVESAFSKD